MSKRGITPSVAKGIIESRGGQMSKLQTLRYKKNISQNELSNMSGVPVRSIRGYEQKSRPIDGAGLDVLCKLCKCLNCKIEDILEDESLVEEYLSIK